MASFGGQGLRLTIFVHYCMLFFLVILLLIAKVSTDWVPRQQDSITIYDSYAEQKASPPRAFFSVSHFLRPVKPFEQSLLDTLLDLSPFPNFQNLDQNVFTESEKLMIHNGLPAKNLETGKHDQSDIRRGTKNRYSGKNNRKSPHKLVTSKASFDLLAPYSSRNATDILFKAIEREKQNTKEDEKRRKSNLFSPRNKFSFWKENDLSRDKTGHSLVDNKLFYPVITEVSLGNDLDVSDAYKLVLNGLKSQNNERDNRVNKLLPSEGAAVVIKIREHLGDNVSKSKRPDLASLLKDKELMVTENKQEAPSMEQKTHSIVSQTLKEWLKTERNQRVSPSTGTSPTVSTLTNGQRRGKGISPNRAEQDSHSSQIKEEGMMVKPLAGRGFTTFSDRLVFSSNIRENDVGADLGISPGHDETLRFKNGLRSPREGNLTSIFTDNTVRKEQKWKNIKQVVHVSEADAKSDSFELLSTNASLNNADDGNLTRHTEDLHSEKNKNFNTVMKKMNREASFPAQHKLQKRHSAVAVDPVFLRSFYNIGRRRSEEKHKQVDSDEAMDNNLIIASNKDVKSPGDKIMEKVANMDKDLNEYLKNMTVERNDDAIQVIDSLSTPIELRNKKPSTSDGSHHDGLKSEKTEVAATDTVYADDFRANNKKLSNFGNSDYEIREGDEESEDYADGVEQLEFRRKRRRSATARTRDRRPRFVQYLNPDKVTYKPGLDGRVKYHDKVNGTSDEQSNNAQLGRKENPLEQFVDVFFKKPKKNHIVRRGSKIEELSPKKSTNHTSLLENADVIFILKSKQPGQAGRHKESQHTKKAKLSDSIKQLESEYSSLLRNGAKSKLSKSKDDEVVSKTYRHVPNPSVSEASKDGNKLDSNKSTQKSHDGPLIQRVTPPDFPLKPPHPLHPHLHGGKPVDLVWKRHHKTGRHGAAVLCFLSVTLILVVILVLALTKATNDSNELRRNDSSTALYVNNPHY